MPGFSSTTVALQRSIGRCDEYAAIAKTVLTPMAARLGATAAAFFQVTVNDGRPIAIERADVHGPFAGAAELYTHHLFKEDPLYRARSATPISLRALMVEQGPFPSHPLDGYRRDLLLNNGIGDIIGIYFPLSSGSGQKILQVSFQRRAGMPDYTAEDEALLADLAPILRLTFGNLALGADVAILSSVVSAMSERFRQDVKLVDERTGRGYLCAIDDDELRSRDWESMGECLTSSALPAHLSLWVTPANDGCQGSYDDLTCREREVVGTLRAGHSNASMAHALGISIRTVENHLRSIYAKLSVSSRTQLLALLSTH